MDIMQSSPSASLRGQVSRRAIDRMEAAYQDGAKHELKRRETLSRVELHLHLTEAAHVHLNEFKANGDVSHVRWANELLTEAVALGLKEGV
jgi:hypothetical protein